MDSVISGDKNVAVGVAALAQSSGSGNIGIGWAPGHTITGDNNILLGFTVGMYIKGSNNIALGTSAGINLTTGSDNIDIANAGVAGESGVVRVGTAGTQRAAFVAGIAQSPIAASLPVVICAGGRLGVPDNSASSAENVKPMAKASEAIFSLQPVTFHYKQDLDSLGTTQFGLMAEDVAKVDPDLVARDEKGKPCTVRYEAVNAMLLNEFLTEHRKGVEQAQLSTQQTARMASQQSEIAELRAGMTQLQAALKAQSAQLQKVSEQMSARRAVPQLASTGD